MTGAQRSQELGKLGVMKPQHKRELQGIGTWPDFLRLESLASESVLYAHDLTVTDIIPFSLSLSARCLLESRRHLLSDISWFLVPEHRPELGTHGQW